MAANRDVSRWRFKLVGAASQSCSAMLLILAAAGATQASEPTTELATGGLTFAAPPKLKTEREDIVISADRVQLSYLIRNTSADPHSAAVAFALPDIDMLALDGAPIDTPAFEPQNSGNFVGFSATVDGQAPDIFIQSHVLSMGLIDSTQIIAGLKLPLYPFHPDLPDRLNALPPAAKADLVARSLARPGDGQLEPLWTLRSTMFWQQPFAANQSRTIAAVYRPVAGIAAWAADTATDIQRQFCVTDMVAKQLTARAGLNGPITVRWVHFNFYTGAQARGPATQARLAIDGGKGQAFTCHEGMSGQINGTRELTSANHVDEGEIRVLFID